jgi:hypothetical protein
VKGSTRHGKATMTVENINEMVKCAHQIPHPFIEGKTELAFDLGYIFCPLCKRRD